MFFKIIYSFALDGLYHKLYRKISIMPSPKKWSSIHVNKWDMGQTLKSKHISKIKIGICIFSNII